MQKVTLEAFERVRSGKSGLNTLRREKKVPGIFYSKNDEALPLWVLETAINKLVFTSETHIVNLSVADKKTADCIIKDVQFDPVTDKVIHFDLLGLVEGEKIELDIPIILKGTSIGVREGGQLQQFMHKATVKCIPAEIPEHLEVDITKVKMGHSIHLRDLKFENIEFTQPSGAVVLAVTPPKGMEIKASTDGEITEPEVISRGKDKSEE